MIRVCAPSRLHFGLLSLPTEDGSPSRETNLLGAEQVPGRHFGGAGLMVEKPGCRLTVEASGRWSAIGPMAERALNFARQFIQSLPPEQQTCFHIAVEECAPEHAGLGTGTQLGLAVARALSVACGLAEMNALELARRIGRGQRSSLGIHGFAQGGFLVEGGKGPATTIAPLLVRAHFPDTWRIILVIPTGQQGLHGLSESRAFDQLQNHDLARKHSDALCRLVLLGMLPAVMEGDLPAFGEALFDFNRRVGEMFRSLQGGPYAHSQSAAVVDYIRRQGVAGVGQSSWGPTLFAVAEEDRASHLAVMLQEHFAFDSGEVIITPATNQARNIGY